MLTPDLIMKTYGGMPLHSSRVNHSGLCHSALAKANALKAYKATGSIKRAHDMTNICDKLIGEWVKELNNAN